MIHRIQPLLAGALLALTACTDGTSFNFDQAAQQAQQDFDAQQASAPSGIFKPLFSPADGQIPQTNDLLFKDSTDGTLNIPASATDSEGQAALKTALNTLDGFSTTAPIVAEFSSSIDAATVKAGQSVRVFQVTATAQGAVTGVTRELTAAEYLATVAGTNQDRLVILPLAPLQPKTSYLVVLTSDIKSTAGEPAQDDVAYYLAEGTDPLSAPAVVALEPLRQLVNSYEAAARAADASLTPERIVLAWTFRTQSITDVLTAVKDNAAAGTIQMAATGKDTQAFNPALQGKADVYVGTLTVPYYLSKPSAADPTAPLTGFWHGAGGSFLTQFNPQPVKTADLTIPVIMTVPNANAAGGGTAPAGGWPVVIYQHGITRQRTDLLAVADTLADAGLAGIAIDLPLHGVTDPDNPLKTGSEPTFDLDLVNNTTQAAGPDGKIDASGTHFINLKSLLTSRDNIRQAVSNLLVLRRSLGDIAGVTLDTGKVAFLGHSLGAMVGTVYLAVEDQLGAASLGMPGGGIPYLLDASPTFGPVIQAGLAANGIVKGTPDYDAFLAVAQTLIDAADPVNFGAAASATHPVHLMEVVGGGGNPPDQVIPNSVATAPLAGTEPLVRVMGLTKVTTSQGPGTTPIHGVVHFTAGAHGSLIDPSSSLAATAEMHTEFASFLASGGLYLPITNAGVIQP